MQHSLIALILIKGSPILQKKIFFKACAKGLLAPYGGKKPNDGLYGLAYTYYRPYAVQTLSVHITLHKARTMM